MRVYALGVDIDLDGPTAANGTSQNMANADFPFIPGNTVVGVLKADSWSEAEANACGLLIQGSDDNASWTTLLTLDADNYPLVMGEIVVSPYMRYRMNSGTAGDGRGSAYLLGN